MADVETTDFYSKASVSHCQHMFAYLLLVPKQYLLLPKFLLLKQGLPCFTMCVMVATLLLGKQFLKEKITMICAMCCLDCYEIANLL